MTYVLNFLPITPLRTCQHTMAANEGVTKAIAFTKLIQMIQIRSFLIFVTNYFPILYLRTFSETHCAWDFHLFMTGISGNVLATSEDFR